MRATGIVRRIDDLGRVVIPKEIRRTMNIKELEPLEIFIQNNDEIVVKKYKTERPGVVRKIDDLGRLVIPIEVRKALEIKEGKPLEIFIQFDDEIVLKKYKTNNEQCIFCEEDDEDKLIPFKEKYVCNNCLQSLAKRR